MKEPKSSRVVPLRPRPEAFVQTVRALAASTGNIAWSGHARERMVERGITDRVAIQVLRSGWLKGEIDAGKKPGEWKAKLCMTVKGRRDVGVVTIVVDAKRLLIKTVEWEDAK